MELYTIYKNMRGNKFKYLYKSALIRNDSYLGNNYKILDIGMRMLQPHELYTTQGFLSGGYYFSKMNGDDKNDERGIWQKLLPTVYKFWVFYYKKI